MIDYIPRNPLPNDPSRIALARSNASAVASVLGVRVKRKTKAAQKLTPYVAQLLGSKRNIPGGIYFLLERDNGDVAWTCAFDDKEFFIYAENKSVKRLKIEIAAALKAKGENGVGTDLSADLTREIGVPVFTGGQWSARTKEFILKSSFRRICAEIDFRNVQSFTFTEYQLFSRNAFSNAQQCAGLLQAVDKLMLLLHEQRLAEIKELHSSSGLKVRRQLCKLTIGDLKTFGAWEFASDEEGVTGQDESSLRPCSEKAVPKGEGCYVLRTTFNLADGTQAIGFITSVDDPEYYGLMEPTVILGGKHLPLVLRRPNNPKRQLIFWGKGSESVFPLHFSSDVAYNGKRISASMSDFITVK